jgi:hypothetical protein
MNLHLFVVERSPNASDRDMCGASLIADMVSHDYLEFGMQRSVFSLFFSGMVHIRNATLCRDSPQMCEVALGEP